MRSSAALLVALSCALTASAVAAGPADPDELITYKHPAGGDLKLHVFYPPRHSQGPPRAAIVFFFGGGWVGGSAEQFYPQARYFADRGMVAISAEYRTRRSHGTDPWACIADGKSAIRWVRAHAQRLHIDPRRIVAAGGSAGGHVACCTALLQTGDEPDEDPGISSRPQALVLFNPVLDTTASGYGAARLGARARAASPLHNLRADLPPAIVFHGNADRTVPFERAEAFARAMRALGNECELVPYAGCGHGFFNRSRGLVHWADTLRRAFAFLAAHGLTPPAELARRPNFVIILADDLGYGDLGCYGGSIATPRIDRLASEGLRFTDFHSNGAVCSPTRAALLTGRYQQRAGIPGVIVADPSNPRHRHGLQERELCLAEALRRSGYATALIGKWHLGYEPAYNPTLRGFDLFRGYLSGNVDYFAHIDQAGRSDWWHQRREVPEEGYVTHLLTDHALDFLERCAEQPFLLYIAHEAPHYPYQGPRDEALRRPGKPGIPKLKRARIARAYAEMVAELDRSVGAVMKGIEKLGLESRTLVFFASDNGANSNGSNAPLRGFKGSLWEGGHRVPAIARWPGHIAAGAQSAALAATFDLMPTFLAQARAARPADPRLDGVNLSDHLLAARPLAPRRLVWNGQALREGPWKLILPGKKGRGGTLRPRLFNLDEDLGEQNDLAARNRERVAAMLAALATWRADVARDASAQPRR